ncbi:peptidoglycan DD-metalloendopeptidase family protein [Jiangella asiatica]|uniref:peptidoglycan DD-metalloendopeptidase family protein n=1 Tax=Jiangella asiatica TaxID=2530372 RepID=UPI00193DE208|nr:peptidoglycan DD-metalloendopeptidase family protein [Jiangella asiatica]
MNLIVAATTLAVVLAGWPAAWVLPIGPPAGPAPVVHGFDPPDQPWLAGHRGVDLAGTVGAEVRAAGPGVVAYAGPLAGRGVVVVDHGTLRTTYEPVTASVTLGDAVAAGQPVGTLAAAGSHCAPAACLHWGAREGQRYVDPLALVGTGADIQLLPLDERTLSGDPPPPASTALGWPVASPHVTSPFGIRVHPVTGVLKLHDGTDFAAACGTPIRAAAAGRVTDAGERGAYGLQVTVDHGRLRGTPVTTSYGHLSAVTVAAGQTIPAGHAVGRAGDTGLSTGCHLHFMLYAAGQVTDPMPWLPAGQAASPPTRLASGPLPRPSDGAGHHPSSPRPRRPDPSLPHTRPRSSASQVTLPTLPKKRSVGARRTPHRAQRTQARRQRRGHPPCLPLRHAQR